MQSAVLGMRMVGQTWYSSSANLSLTWKLRQAQKELQKVQKWQTGQSDRVRTGFLEEEMLGPASAGSIGFGNAGVWEMLGEGTCRQQ